MAEDTVPLFYDDTPPEVVQGWEKGILMNISKKEVVRRVEAEWR